MGKFAKAVSIVLLIGAALIAGFIAFVHFYLTKERVKTLVIPKAEEALGRKVAIGDINIGLFTGITIRDFLVKETDSETDFVSAKAFVLSYDLMPLLQKKLVISEIRLDEPVVQILRDRNGQFNFSTLAIMAGGKDQKAEERKKSPAPTAALPIALSFDQIHLNRARIKIRDQLNKIPAVDASTSARLNIALGRTLQDLDFNGSFDLEAVIEHGSAKIELTGKGNVDRKNLDIALDSNLDGEKVHSEAKVINYFQAPEATINISSDSLNIDKILAMAAGMPETAAGIDKTPQPRANSSQTVIADSFPPGLTANGTVKVNKALYKKIVTNNFSLIFNLSNGILTVRELSARAYNGHVGSDLKVDLNQPGLIYSGNLGLESVQAGDLGSALMQKSANMLSGTLQTAMSFSGAGTTWPELKKVLSADGSYTLTDGGIRGTPVSSSIANLLGLQELNNISYNNIVGTFKVVEGGRVMIKSSMQGQDVNAETEGIIGLDGSLDLPLTLHLSPPLADKLRARASFARYLTDEEGGASLHLKLAGSLSSPRPMLDMKGVQDQLQQSIQQEILKKLDRSDQETDKQASPESIIKGLFGR